MTCDLLGSVSLVEGDLKFKTDGNVFTWFLLITRVEDMAELLHLQVHSYSLPVA
jgi:hypothetical protein